MAGPTGSDGGNAPGGEGAGPSWQEKWSEIVVRLGDVEAAAKGAPTPRAPSGPPRARVVRAAREDEDDLVLPGDFVPEDPPPLRGDPLARLAWLGFVGGPVALLVLLVAWRGAPLVLPLLCGLAFIGGGAVLMWRMPARRDPFDNDDGAVV